ncbi:hypothetical protein CC99x_006090 [Candidatus Berkiella cookevillensis]|uniref:Uncharacterized protein n=1 Tax=Candidatus Berkiella cookevillensis TaxID=437022 RepID=A0A0Q9YH53_9GAMM|nr:hypothetical protein [Candidatus Berkiella cookevillensis]MCS5708475.1 hypothetical protein [Candidatus Berkiella cookevillensis]
MYLPRLLFIVFLWIHHGSLLAFEVELTQTSPQISPNFSTILHKDEALFVRIQYQSEQPLRFQARGLLNDIQNEKNVRYNPSPVYAQGKGEAIAWLAYDGPTSINKIRVNIYNQQWQQIGSQDLNLSANWTNRIASTPTPIADWAQTLNNIQQNSVSTAAMNTESSFLFGFLMQIMFLMTPGYLILQIYTLCKYEDNWRKAARIPLFVMIPLGIYTIFALIAGSNLWPLMLIFISPFSFIYLLGVVILKYLRRNEAYFS